MKRSTMAVLVAVVTALTLSGITATSASATCRSVVAGQNSNFDSRGVFWKACSIPEAGTGGFSKIRGTEWNKSAPGVWCYRVQNGTDRSTYSTSSCSDTALQATGGWFKSSEGPPSFWLFYSKLGTVLTLAKGDQTFTLANNNKIVCSQASGRNEVPETLLEVLYTPIAYTACKAFGDSATFSLGEVTLFAGGLFGFPSLLATFSVPAASCSVIFGAAPNNNELLEIIKYTNLLSGKLEALSSLKKVEYEVSGSGATECGTGKTTGLATYEGTVEIELEGGTVKRE